MKDPHVEEVAFPEFPPPDHPDFGRVRDDFIDRVKPAIWKLLGYDPQDYQRDFHSPPETWRYLPGRVKGMFGAKRIGKSVAIPFDIVPGVFVPGFQARGYAPEHENAEREFRYLNRILFQGFQGNPPLAKYFPWLIEKRSRAQLNPREGALELSWGNPEDIDSVQFLSKSAERMRQWLGEPIDRAFYCEPGLFPDADCWTKLVKPNLSDRRGEACMAGTVDFPWLHDTIHAQGHDPEKFPDIYCRCEIHRRENKYVWDEEAYRRAQRSEDARTFAINWQGLWGVYSNVAYEKYEFSRHVRSIPVEAWKKLKRGLPGWDRFLVLDVGRYMALGEFVVNPKGHMMMIDLWTNYEYRQGRIFQTAAVTVRPWISEFLRTRYFGQDDPLIVVDRAAPVPIKNELMEMGLPTADSSSDHVHGVAAVNEYFGLNAITISARCDNVIFEIPRVRWTGKETDVGGKQHLRRGNDHSADLVRYACAYRPVAGNFERKQERSVVLEDEALIAAEKLRGGFDEEMGALY